MVVNKKSEPSLLKLVLRVQSNLRRALAPIGVTPLQAGVLCYVREHSGVGVVVAAAAFRVEPPTLVDVVQDLVRKGWIIKRRAIKDRRVVCLRLSRKGEALVRRIEPLVRDVEIQLSKKERNAFGMCLYYDFQP